MIQADEVEQLAGGADALDPPGVPALSVHVPAVEWIAPHWPVGEK